MKVWVYHGIVWKCPKQIYLPLLSTTNDFKQATIY